MSTRENIRLIARGSFNIIAMDSLTCFSQITLRRGYKFVLLDFLSCQKMSDYGKCFKILNTLLSILQ